MNLEVTVTRDYLSPVLADLAQRRGTIQEIQTRQENKIVIGFVPLAEIMVGKSAFFLFNTGVFMLKKVDSQGFSRMHGKSELRSLDHLHSPQRLSEVCHTELAPASMAVFSPSEHFLKCRVQGVPLKHTHTIQLPALHGILVSHSS